MPRFHVPLELSPGAQVALPAGAARHVQVLRLQPGHAITLFDGRGGEWDATVARMGRSEVDVVVGAHHAIEREAARPVHLAVGLMAPERMDWLVEKATELGATSLTPILSARSSLRLAGDRVARKRAHWLAVAAGACEQSGRNRLLDVRQQLSFQEFIEQSAEGARWLLTLAPGVPACADAMRSLPSMGAVTLLSGPEGGLDAREESAALAAGFSPLGLGTRVLRAETAPLAALACLTLC